MTWFRLTRAALVLAAISVTLGALLAAAPAKKPAVSKAKQLERGMRVTLTSACNDCHTPGSFYGAPDYDRRLSGSELGWQGPWGVSYPRNLTPDMETGIGKWSEQDIVTAVRTGKRPDGTVLLPPMPWPMYNSLTDEDVWALAAYLKSIPAVSHKVPDKVAPGQNPTTSVIVIPPPSVWDAPRTPPPAADK